MNPNRHWASFTLVELLVGITVFSLLVLLIFGIMEGATKIWRQQSSEEGSFREARAALNTLSRDMRGAVMSTNTTWFYCDGTNQLAFLTTLPDAAQGTTVNRGDICAVGYSLEWGVDDASDSQSNMSLYRYVSFSDSTYANIIQGANPIENIFSKPDGVNTVRELIARDVSRVSFACYTNDASGVSVMCPNPTTLPNMVDVTVTTLNDKVVPLLTTQAQWANTNSSIIQQNVESFTLRVRGQGP